MTNRESDQFDDQFDEEMRALALMKGHVQKEVIKNTVCKSGSDVMRIGWTEAFFGQNGAQASLEGDARHLCGCGGH